MWHVLEEKREPETEAVPSASAGPVCPPESRQRLERRLPLSSGRHGFIPPVGLVASVEVTESPSEVRVWGTHVGPGLRPLCRLCKAQ